ncbi:hypothetical protein RI367_006808 [Sorochytrium milnesiophthora]
MFKFNFVADALEEEAKPAAEQQQQQQQQQHNNKEPGRLLDVMSLQSEPLTVEAETVHFSSPDIGTVYKRSLSDVKLEIARNDDRYEHLQALVFDQNTDLVKGVYEGGLKTWECSLDLVEWLHEWLPSAGRDLADMRLGCGSAIPSLYLLGRTRSQQQQHDDTLIRAVRHLTLQDYNAQVLQLVTVPNVLLNTLHRPPADAQVDVHDAFETELDLAHVIELPHVSFASGDWQSLTDPLLSCNDGGKRYDLILTSETIYEESSAKHLLQLIASTLSKPDGIALVAAKTFYFGVGGGMREFERLVDQHNKLAARDDQQQLEHTIVKDFRGSSVRREILQLRWKERS